MIVQKQNIKCKNLLYLHSTNGIGYQVHVLHDKNIEHYVPRIPSTFFTTYSPWKKYVYVKVMVLCTLGGIWIDIENTLVMDSLDPLFDLLEKKDGFFIQDGGNRWKTMMGSKANTAVLLEWMEQINMIEHENHLSISNPRLLDRYEILKGVFPTTTHLLDYIEKPYEYYQEMVVPNQPFIVYPLNIYHKIEEIPLEKLWEKDHIPFTYFIQKSLENVSFIDYDFLEIGTSNFETCIENATDDTVGISVEAIKYYLDQLPNKKKVKKLNVAISNQNSMINVYYIPEKKIEKHKLPYWFKGCNSILTYHPLHIKYNLMHLCEKEQVNVM